jgi:hypothetical protein
VSKYYVVLMEVWERAVVVEAENEDDAFSKARKDDVIEEQAFEYSHNLYDDETVEPYEE